MTKKIKRIQNRNGFSLPELLIAVLILVPLFSLGLQSFVHCMELSDLARNSSLAVAGVKSRLANMESTDFDDVYPTFNNTTFTINSLTGIGKTYVDQSDPENLLLIISFCWRERNGRVIGEDKNLNGVLDSGEDTNNNGRIDSIVTISTRKFNL